VNSVVSIFVTVIRCQILPLRHFILLGLLVSCSKLATHNIESAFYERYFGSEEKIVSSM